MNGDYQQMTTALLGFFNNYLIPSLFTMASGVFLVLGIMNGIRWAKATTDEEKVKAKKAVVGLFIGMIVSVVSVWAVPFLMNFLFSVFSNGGLQMQQ